MAETPRVPDLDAKYYLHLRYEMTHTKVKTLLHHTTSLGVCFKTTPSLKELKTG